MDFNCWSPGPISTNVFSSIDVVNTFHLHDLPCTTNSVENIREKPQQNFDWNKYIITDTLEKEDSAKQGYDR